MRRRLSLFRDLGAFVGHVWKGITTDPARSRGSRRVVRREVEEQRHDQIVLRRTTIEEIEFKGTDEAGDDPPRSMRDLLAIIVQ